jgi:hypothetical protein
MRRGSGVAMGLLLGVEAEGVEVGGLDSANPILVAAGAVAGIG